MEKMEEDKEIQAEANKLSDPEKKVVKKMIKLNKKAIIIAAIVIFLVVLVYLGKGLFVAATVNGNPISRWSVVSMLEKESGKNLLDSLIIEKLVAGEAKNQKIVISDEDVAAEIKKIDDQIVAQGGTLEVALTQQGITLEVLEKQILFQKQVEKLLADKLVVTDEEVAKYMTDNQITITPDQEATINAQARADLLAEKLNAEAPKYIADLKDKAKIKYFVNY